MTPDPDPFLHPQYLWLLAGVPILMLFWGAGLWHHWRMRRRFGDLTNLEETSRISWAWHGWLRGGLFAVSLVSMIVGLARPQLLSRDVRPVPTATDVVFMLDTSPSMFARDMDPNRLGRAEHIIQQFILRKLPDDRYALVGFNYNGAILSYLTREPQTILVYFDYLNRTTEPGVGTNMGAALVSALRVIDADERITPENRSRRRVLALISDGDDTIGQWEDPITDIVRRQLKLYTFGLGTATGAAFPLELSPRGEVVRYAISASGERLRSKAEATTLREFARRTNARFFRGEDERQVDAAIEEILSRGRPVAGYQSSPVRRDLYFYFFAAAFVCMLAAAFL
jgi:Ca-activated chloride channel family protein